MVGSTHVHHRLGRFSLSFGEFGAGSYNEKENYRGDGHEYDVDRQK